MPASCVMPVSLKPLLLGLSVSPNAFTHELIEKSNEFTVNFHWRHRRAVKQAGGISSRDVDKFKAIGLHPIPSLKVKAPLVEECIGHLECGVIERYTFGDHTLFIGEVQRPG